MRCRFDTFRFRDIDEFKRLLWPQDIEPIQLSRGRLNLGFTALAFDDVVITRLDSNRRISDRLYMDPSWLLLVVLLAPQRWDANVAPAESLVVIAPGTDYRCSVPEGFRCVDVAVRLDLATEMGFRHLCRLKGADAIIPVTSATARRAEHQVERLLLVAARSGSRSLDGTLAECLRESCLEYLRFLRDVSASSTGRRARTSQSTRNNRFDLAEKALEVIESSPIDSPPAVKTLADSVHTTRRTLLSAFQETLGTSPSRYILAKRLNNARRSLIHHADLSVTNAALDSGFDHFGRFSRHYRALFGETPSTTLRRARLN